MKLKLGEVRQIIKETAEARTLIEAKQTADRIILEKDSFLGNIARKAGWSNPSKDVDDPKFVAKTLDKSIDVAKSKSSEFQVSGLRSAREINRFHDAIKDVLDKVTTMADTLGPERAKAYQKRMIELARDFYSMLKNESDRIDSYLKTLGDDLQDKGISPKAASGNTTGLVKKGDKKNAPVHNHPVEKEFDVDDDAEVEKLIGQKPARNASEKQPLFNYDDPEQVRDFLRGRSKVRA